MLKRLAPDADARAGRIEAELHACQIELISEPCPAVAAAVAQLGELRQAVRATGAGLMASGTHPSGLEGDAEITDKARYERIRELGAPSSSLAGPGVPPPVLARPGVARPGAQGP